MVKFLSELWDTNLREVKRLQRKVEQINALESQFSQLDDNALRAKTIAYRERYAKGETLDDLLPEAFATVREAARRVLGQRHYDVQLMGGMVLHEGKIAEMKTGEGKTLVATLPVYLNALSGKGVHVVTVNDYLAKRDSEWMGKVYRFLGLSVGVILHHLNSDERRIAYNSDITYGTNNEFGFDYLRDNMAFTVADMVQRELNYAIVDEVDSILIDEARTPLIISGQAEESTELYYKFAQVVPKLRRDEDYTIDEKARTVAVTEEGVAKVEQILHVENLYDDANTHLVHHLNQALRAKELMKRDRDYVVKDGEVIIVDEFTGRLMFGRRYSEGLHQAIEAKENVKIENESQTLATITFQNYFRMYKKLAGMTGTAETEEAEFRKIYNLPVIVIPTNVPMVRADHPDVVYKTEKSKFNAVVDEIAEIHQTGRPILVGTISIEKSEELSNMLKRRGIPHQVLNAKYHEKEAEIIAQAGRSGTVTIATNMAGRGTDIVLGGNTEFLARDLLHSRGIEYQEATPEEYQLALSEAKQATREDHEKVVTLGGLHIIGTERHESRRIDNQLRGRSGRQGDPGSSRFFVAMEDDLMRLFGGEMISGWMEKLGWSEDMPIEHSAIAKRIEAAQRKVEARNFEIRKHVLDYDDVLNKQREIIYELRKMLLLGEDVHEKVISMFGDVTDHLLEVYANEKIIPEEWDLEGLLQAVYGTFLPPQAIELSDIDRLNHSELREAILDKAMEYYQAKETEIGAEHLREIERFVMLRTIDVKWMDHLEAMDGLKEGIGLRAYAQNDPLVAYKIEAYQMFKEMRDTINEEVVRELAKFQVVSEERLVQRPKVRNISTNLDEDGAQAVHQRVTGKKVGRNDPCPCGSGKKYKKCCGQANG
ncbi:protein translocase subunit secA [Hydrogenispora ethanolica]|jgi:preprotein translocase subunit SecA|uniref:Protein translocase subunit SecA n=1 Tax=Hydrogenispora ethanolica TaxID=1082276 RepID=A0A4R1QMH7_HYDET|nr:preprotein translocase subunit SecA [Hydrogenispora ethanolica]TCL54876.1 protein translocase subunit secA [Hydrogenispora ethanolica]